LLIKIKTYTKIIIKREIIASKEYKNWLIAGWSIQIKNQIREIKKKEFYVNDIYKLGFKYVFFVGAYIEFELCWWRYWNKILTN
jgi:hypothetical protein